MNDYIKRETLIKAYCQLCGGREFECKNCKEVKLFKNLLSADAMERKYGEWKMDSDNPDRLICSECGTQWDVWHWESEQMHFCPNCGVEMRGVHFKTYHCETCKQYECGLCLICKVEQDGSRTQYEKKTITNADKIRSMTDEELAVGIRSDFGSDLDWCNGHCEGQTCEECILKWLREEIK
jgi:hypothetical protein